MLSYDREKHFCIYTFFAIKYFRFSLNLCKNYNLAENVHPSFTATPLLKVRSSHPSPFSKFGWGSKQPLSLLPPPLMQESGAGALFVGNIINFQVK